MSLREYIRDSYPRRIREEAFDEGSITYKYDLVRSNLFEFLEQAILDSSRNLVLTTSDILGIREMEKFLGIKEDLSKTLEERRVEILSGLYGGKSTVQSIKNLVYQTVGGDENSVTLEEEKDVDGTTGNDLFSYKVKVQLGRVSKQFKPDILELILKKIHPFHCNVVVETESIFEDAIGVGDSVQTGLHSPLLWGDENNPLPTDTMWVEGDNILEGNFWN